MSLRTCKWADGSCECDNEEPCLMALGCMLARAGIPVSLVHEPSGEQFPIEPLEVN